MRAFVFPITLLLAAACGPQTTRGGDFADSGLHSTGDSGVRADAGPEVDAGVDPCRINAVPIELTIDEDGVADVQAVPVRYQGQDGYLSIDTGSAQSLIFGKPGDPAYVAHYADVQIGCETLPVGLMTLPAFQPETLNGKPVWGALGLDFFSGVKAELDYPGRRVVRYTHGEPDLTHATAVPTRYVDDRILVDVELDAQPLVLIFDAGAHDTFWVGVEGPPTDPTSQIGTADGNTFTVRVGTGQLKLGSDALRPIVVLRTLSFPYVDAELHELSANGLLGLTGIGFRRIIFDRPASKLWVGPVVTP